jgi:hypothetical protein
MPRPSRPHARFGPMAEAPGEVAEWLEGPHSKDGWRCCVECRCLLLSLYFQAISEVVGVSSAGAYHAVFLSLGPNLGPTEWPVPRL